MTKSTKWYIISIAVMLGILAACWWTVWNEIDKQYPKPKKVAEIKIYTGKWVEDTRKVGEYWSVGYLEVIGR